MAVRLRKVVSFFVLNQLFNSNFLTAKHLTKRALRFNSSSPIIAKKLVIHEYGDPNKIVQLEEETLPPPKIDEVVVKMLLAAVNPADINTIQGVYPLNITLPFIPGGEGVGEVVAVGPMVKVIHPGQRVIPNKEAAGTWRSHAIFKEEELFTVEYPNDEIDLLTLAGVMVNPSTAYRMLKDFVELKKGDTVIQNGANSAVGQNVIQLCKSWGILTINIVRDRPDLPKLKEYLQSLGATYVITEDEIRTSLAVKELKPKLGLNCVGGKSALNLLRSLDNGGSMVTYGGMSREPITIPTSSLIFKDISVKGFWMTRWHGQNRFNLDQLGMIEELFLLVRDGKLKPPAHTFVSLSDFRTAIMNTMTVKGFTGVKYFIDFNL